MKTILITLILTTLTIPFANASPLIIELGEDYTLKGKTKKIWIENSKVLAAQAAADGVSLKPVGLGVSLIRQNDQAIKVIVVPVNSKKTYADWLQLSQKFLGLSVEICEDVICLKGNLFRFQDFKRIIEFIEKQNSAIYLALSLSDELKGQITAYAENHMRNQGLTPLKITYAQPWKLSYSTKETAADYKAVLGKVGILAVENKQKIEIADNVRVEIHVAEVKKDFGRTLGIRWPSQYQAQIIDGNLNAGQTIAGLLNADENEGQIKILATPNLVCRSGKEAEFFAGGEFPIKVLNFKFQDIIWKKYGIIMKVKPTVDAAGQISLQIESEVSSIDPSRTVDGIPALHSHRVSSHFDFIKSKTIALSGLIKNETSTNSEGLPFLSSLPILGSLFSSKQFKENKSELVIFVTPKLMEAN